MSEPPPAPLGGQHKLPPLSCVTLTAGTDEVRFFSGNGFFVPGNPDTSRAKAAAQKRPLFIFRDPEKVSGDYLGVGRNVSRVCVVVCLWGVLVGSILFWWGGFWVSWGICGGVFFALPGGGCGGGGGRLLRVGSFFMVSWWGGLVPPLLQVFRLPQPHLTYPVVFLFGVLRFLRVCNSTPG